MRGVIFRVLQVYIGRGMQKDYSLQLSSVKEKCTEFEESKQRSGEANFEKKKNAHLLAH
jgi:hypothetical protein